MSGARVDFNITLRISKVYRENKFNVASILAKKGITVTANLFCLDQQNFELRL